MRVLLRFSMRVSIWLGSGGLSRFWLILPFGMLCLSAARIAFVRILLATCGFVGFAVFNWH